MRYEVAAAAANIIGTEQPCRVRLRLWHCSADDPTASLEVPSLTIPDAVLCSEMGVHFSACGRFLAACVACQVRSCLAGDDLFTSLRLGCACSPDLVCSAAHLRAGYPTWLRAFSLCSSSFRPHDKAFISPPPPALTQCYCFAPNFQILQYCG